jgi:hypothetical protein
MTIHKKSSISEPWYVDIKDSLKNVWPRVRDETDSGPQQLDGEPSAT